MSAERLRKVAADHRAEAAVADDMHAEKWADYLRAVADWLDEQADEMGDLNPALTWQRLDDLALAVCDAWEASR